MATLNVYVTEDCMGCVESRTIVDKIRQDYPELTVNLVDLNPNDWPEDIFAVPSYKLDGKLVSLGNPSPSSIQTWFASGNLADTQNGTNQHGHAQTH